MSTEGISPLAWAMTGLLLASGQIVSASEVVPNPSGVEWYMFQHFLIGQQAEGCAVSGGCVVPAATAVAGPAAPWTFSGPVRLDVTDAFDSGDIFDVYNFGGLIGTTSFSSSGFNVGNNPDLAFANLGIRSGPQKLDSSLSEIFT